MYTATRDYENDEFGFAIEEGAQIADGDLEPDLIANLLALGVLEAPAPPRPKRKRKAKSED